MENVFKGTLVNKILRISEKQLWNPNWAIFRADKDTARYDEKKKKTGKKRTPKDANKERGNTSVVSHPFIFKKEFERENWSKGVRIKNFDIFRFIV